MNTKYVIEVIETPKSKLTSFVVCYVLGVEFTWSSQTVEEARVHKKFCETHYGGEGTIYKICKVEEVE